MPQLLTLAARTLTWAAVFPTTAMLFLASPFASAQQQPGSFEPASVSCARCKCWSLTDESPVVPPPHGYDPREAPGDTDLLNIDLQIDLTAPGYVISGSNTMTVRSLVNGLTQFSFMLDLPMLVQRGLSGQAADNNFVTLNGTTVASVTTPALGSYRRTVTLDRPYAMGETFTVKVDYRGNPTNRGFGSYSNGSTLSEPYYAGTWWPVKDGDVNQPGDNGDKATGSISVTIPGTQQAVSNGLLTSVTVPAPGKATYHWSTNYPTSPYLFFFCVRNYHQWQQTYSYPLADGSMATMPVQFSLYATADTTANRTALERSLSMLATFRDIFGEYPFVNEKYGIYQFDFSGGQEHQTYTGQGFFDEWITAHELAHQWWGDNVTCEHWNDIWLNEGFATCAEALWAERKPGSTGIVALRSYMSSLRNGSSNNNVYLRDNQLGSVSTIFDNSTVYDKGAWVLHQLRHLVGDATFFQILHDYRDLYQGRTATTQDFADVASATSGRDLSWFFTQWVYGMGRPSYQWAWQPVTINWQPFARIYVQQTQSTTWPGAGAPPGYFRAPLDFSVNEGLSSRAIQLDNNARTQYFLVPLNASATGMSLDSTWLFYGNSTAVSYPPGPAKVALTDPAPGTQFILSRPAIQVFFSEPENAPAGAFSLLGPDGPTPITFSLNSGSTVAYATPTQPLAPGDYTLSWDATQITSVNGGALLDGETSGDLPSGDGQAGGSGFFTFSVLPCLIDFNQDGVSDQGDVDYLIDAIYGETVSSFPTDLNYDGVSDIGDIYTFKDLLAGAPCP